jgi:long-chain fatty acid transport protein
MRKKFSSYAKFICLSAFYSICNYAYGSGLQLFEQTGSLAGRAGAGDAILDDATASFLNPAGLVQIKKTQLSANLSVLQLNTTFNGKSLWFHNQFPATNSGEQTISAAGGTLNFIPSLYAAIPITDRISLGFHLAGPFGLALDYPEEGFQRYSVTHAMIKAFDIGPSLAVKLSDKLSVGLSVDAQQFSGEMSVVAGLPLKVFDNPKRLDSTIKNEFSDWAYGWHGGLLYQLSSQTRLGLSYHSAVIHHATGSSTITGPLALAPSGSRTSHNLALRFPLPAYTTLSLYHQATPAWAIMGSLTYTQWSILQTITTQNIAAVDGVFPKPTNNLTVIIPEQFRNTWRLALGTDYSLSEAWLMRTGIGYDQTPVNAKHRNLLLPDSNRFMTSLGAHYQVNTKIGLDAGWTHYFMQNAELNVTQAIGPGSIHNQGVSHNSADLLGLQFTWAIY